MSRPTAANHFLLPTYWVCRVIWVPVYILFCLAPFSVGGLVALGLAGIPAQGTNPAVLDFPWLTMTATIVLSAAAIWGFRRSLFQFERLVHLGKPPGRSLKAELVEMG